MGELDGALRAGSRAKAAALAHGLDGLRLLFAANFLFDDGLERAHLDALAAADAALDVHDGDLRVAFEERPITLAAAPLPCATEDGMSFGPWATPARNTPAVLVSTGRSLQWDSMKNPKPS